MWSSLSLLPLLGSLGSFSEAKPVYQPSVTFLSPSQISLGSAQNVVVEFSGDVNGELTITYGSCDGAAIISDAKQRIGATHVGDHPLAARHVDHKDRRPSKFVWLTPSSTSGGCLRAFLDDELVGQSQDLRVTKRMTRRSEKKSFAEVAGDDSMWFDGVAYLQQKQPDEAFVAATKSKSFGILGGGMSGLMSSVSSYFSASAHFCTCGLNLRLAVDARLCRYPQLEDLGVFSAGRWSLQDCLSEQYLSRGGSVPRAWTYAFPSRDHGL